MDATSTAEADATEQPIGCAAAQHESGPPGRTRSHSLDPAAVGPRHRCTGSRTSYCAENSVTTQRSETPDTATHRAARGATTRGAAVAQCPEARSTAARLTTSAGRGATTGRQAAACNGATTRGGTTAGDATTERVALCPPS
ncbi:hypothetical protein F3087_11160 [Nocardia colli]|uniref:Uncharacterized protein n=1 Tax=Nocardia colli TaxID=2545717 RepID=A0A5N0EJN4_9NOCA|nr:hypothetical protein [Nocardia colli]KAA8889472.1 hypothetical protein F3087_11160 [Nocardia colli]